MHSGLFDHSYYLSTNPDVAKAGVDPLKHSLVRGAEGGRDPNPLFDTSYYLSKNPDVARARVNPLVHYLIRGACEGRDPHVCFDNSYYLEQNPDVAKADGTALAHYLAQGAGEGRNPHPLFDSRYYISQNPDVAKAGVDPLAHYVIHGANEGRNPHPLFDTSYYLSQNPDVAKAGMNPLAHYLIHGAGEGRNPHPLFDSSYYLSQNPDVAKAGMNPLTHYVLYGAYDGRDPHPHFDSSYYLEQNPDVAEARLNPLAHYVGPGIAEGRDPNPSFDTSAYLEDHPEVALKGVNPLVHYLANPSPFDLRVALRSEFEESGRVLLDGEYDSNPLVSVVIPCFNNGHFLEDAILSSLLACSYPMEIIVVDDGSTDPRSIASIDELADEYRFILVRQAHGGRASARNAGIQHARGKFIQVLDADYLLASGKIDIQVDEFRSDPEIDICISEYELCDGDGLNRRMMNPSTIVGFSFSREEFILHWGKDFSFPIHCALLRRELLEATKFQSLAEASHEEQAFWVELLSESPTFKLDPAALATSRVHGRNGTTSGEVAAKRTQYVNVEVQGPTVSVIIPCYNQGRYLDEAVQSVLGQSYQDFEIIVVDDGSTEQETNQILDNYNRPKTRLIRTNNQGLANARNNGIAACSGKYILALDADDKIGGTYLEKAAHMLEDNESVGIVYCKAELFGEVSGAWELPAYRFPDILLGNVIFCSAMFRRLDWEKVNGYDPRMIYGWEDYDFWLSLIELGREIHCIPDTLFFYRKHSGSMIARMEREHAIFSFAQLVRNHSKLYLKNLPFLLEKQPDLWLELERFIQGKGALRDDRLRLAWDVVGRLTNQVKACTSESVGLFDDEKAPRSNQTQHATPSFGVS